MESMRETARANGAVATSLEPAAPPRPARAPAGTAAPRIGLFGLFGCGNFGNDGSLEAMLATIRANRPDARLLCICNAPEQVEPLFKLDAVSVFAPGQDRPLFMKLDRLMARLPSRLLNLTHAWRQLRKLDLVIVPGTGILDDFATGWTGIPLTLFNWALAARLARTPVAFASIGAGPIHHPWSRWLMKQAVRMADYRSYRDIPSKKFVAGLGLDVTKDALYPDLAFSLADPVAALDQGQPPVIGLGVMTYFGWKNDQVAGSSIYEAYQDKLVAFMRYLLQKGYRIRLLTGDLSDRRAVQDVIARLPESAEHQAAGRLLYTPADSLHDLMVQMAGTEAVVATRFHNIVCALKLAKPTISLGYAVKNDALMQDMGLGAFCHHVERFEVETLIDHFETLTAEGSGFGPMLQESRRTYATRLAEQERILLARFL